MSLLRGSRHLATTLHQRVGHYSGGIQAMGAPEAMFGMIVAVQQGTNVSTVTLQIGAGPAGQSGAQIVGVEHLASYNPAAGDQVYYHMIHGVPLVIGKTGLYPTTAAAIGSGATGATGAAGSAGATGATGPGAGDWDPGDFGFKGWSSQPMASYGPFTQTLGNAYFILIKCAYSGTVTNLYINMGAASSTQLGSGIGLYRANTSGGTQTAPTALSSVPNTDAILNGSLGTGILTCPLSAGVTVTAGTYYYGAVAPSNLLNPSGTDPTLTLAETNWGSAQGASPVPLGLAFTYVYHTGGGLPSGAPWPPTGGASQAPWMAMA